MSKNNEITTDEMTIKTGDIGCEWQNAIKEPQCSTLDAIKGNLAMWVVRQHPYDSPEGLQEAFDLMDQEVEKNLIVERKEGEQGKFFKFQDMTMVYYTSHKQISDFLYAALYDTEVTEQWNTCKAEKDGVGKTPALGISSRFSSTKQEYDFIDIDALLRNAARTTWIEILADKKFNDDFEKKHGKLTSPYQD